MSLPEVRHDSRSPDDATVEQDARDVVARLRLRAQLEAARAREQERSAAAAPAAVSRLDRRSRSRAGDRGRAGGQSREGRDALGPLSRIRILLTPRLSLAALACVAALAAGALLWRSQGAGETTWPLDERPAPVSTAGPAGSADGGRSAGGAGSDGGAGSEGSAAAVPGAGASSSAEAWVHVAGQVAKPGLVHLPADARVAQAIEAAGGAGAKADLARLNLARKVADGEQVYVPAIGEELPAGVGAGGAPSGATAGAGGAGGVGGAGGAMPGGMSGAVIDVNTADVATLDELPGVGPVLAQRIVDYRTEHGPFGSVDDLQDVSGIGPAVLDKLRDKARV